ncbi:MAG: hypothetical protein A2167_05935 [Planctomycetes bacterium RBG_13_46_10]|nr:MAG: hypothetical protein A2167_05935 [Planctomycetes bacterium RBG_13_46_10]
MPNANVLRAYELKEAFNFLKGLKMHVPANIARFDQKLHRWEHDFLVTSGKIVHNKETMGMIVVLALTFLALLLLTFFSQAGSDSLIAPMGPYYH